jgi:hypothetical protein
MDLRPLTLAQTIVLSSTFASVQATTPRDADLVTIPAGTVRICAATVTERLTLNALAAKNSKVPSEKPAECAQNE